jgi:hypothetical protein
VAVGDFSGLALGPLLTGVVLMLFGAIGAIILLVFFVQGPDPRGARFDRRGSAGPWGPAP